MKITAKVTWNRSNVERITKTPANIALSYASIKKQFKPFGDVCITDIKEWLNYMRQNRTKNQFEKNYIIDKQRYYPLQSIQATEKQYCNDNNYKVHNNIYNNLYDNNLNVDKNDKCKSLNISNEDICYQNGLTFLPIKKNNTYFHYTYYQT